MTKHGEPFRARAYQKAQQTVLSHTTDIYAASDLKGKPNIGETILDKLTEFVQTGTLPILEREQHNPINILTNVYGIGPKKAADLVAQGITSIAQLREHPELLNDTQKVGLHYYEDILQRIPRAEIDVYKNVFDAAFANSKGKMEIVGSYRRGASDSGDIDVIITADKPEVFTHFVDRLIQKRIILHVLSRGDTKCLVVAKLGSSGYARRVDFLYTTPAEFPFAVLYFTGSKVFNTVMRNVALEQGYTMNEHGICHMNGKTKGAPVDHLFESEQHIFEFLQLAYKAPSERVDGRSVVRFKIENKPTKSQPSKKIMIVGKDLDEDEPYQFIADNFKQYGISVLNQLNENELASLLREANRAYYNKTPFFTDNQYDIVKEYVESKYPSNAVLYEVGATVERNKATLPYFMGSMDKIKPDTNALSIWTNKYTGPYIISCKLDGVSGLYTTEGALPKLYTRGNGTVGQDISHLIPFLRLPKTKGIAIRGEFIIPRAVFEYKYKDAFSNPRNMVTGIINHKTINRAIQDLHFVAYEVITPVTPPSEQLARLLTLDVETVLYQKVNSLTNESLSKTLLNWRYNYAYEIDGIIVANDAIYERKIGFPEHAFAFKMVLSDQIAEAKVVDVIWTASKDGYLKPRVQIEPIQLSGVQITFATGFNGAFIQDNQIGVGAIIELIRSGDVIPHIRKVVVPAEQAKMPSVPYVWNDTHIDIVLTDLDTDDNVREKNITGFFRGIGVDGLSSGNVKRLMDGGFDSVSSIVAMTFDDFLTVDGFKDKTAHKLYDGIRQKLADASLVTIMAASNVFGRGFSDKKLELIMEAYPSVLIANETPAQKVAKVSAIKGMAIKSAEAFVERIPEFLTFAKSMGVERKLQTSTASPPINTTHPLFGKSVVMTGFRDTRLQDALKQIGAKLGTSVSSKTAAVLVKDKLEDTGKANDARKLGVPLMTPEEFVNRYF